jgi:hypothetical protein
VQELYLKNFNADGVFESSSAYTNGWLAQWANWLAQELTGGEEE